MMKKRVVAIVLCMAMYLVPAAALAQDTTEENPQKMRDAVEELVMSGGEIVASGEKAAEQVAGEEGAETEDGQQPEEEMIPVQIDNVAAQEQPETNPAVVSQEADSVTVTSSSDDMNLQTTFNLDEYDFSDPSTKGLEKFPTDEEFFGVWDEAKGKFVKDPILDYNYVSNYGLDLRAVEEAAKAGDYPTAKAELQKYYNAKVEKRGLSTLGSNSQYEIMVAQLLLQNFHFNGNSNHNVADIFYMGSEWAPVYVEMKSQINRFKTRGDKMMPITICAVNKDDYEAEFYSKENPDAGPEVLGKSAYLEVQIGSTMRRIPVSEDTYTAAGEYRKQNFGAEPYLYAREAAIGETDPVNSDTRRTFLKFNLSDIGASDTITSARLVLWGRWVDKADTPRGDMSYQKRMTAITNYDTGWTENELYFSDTSHTNAIFSYDGEWGTKWVQPNKDRCNPLARFEEELFRFSGWFDKLCAQYQYTGNEIYARTAFMYLHNWITTTYLRYRGCPEVPDPSGNGNAIKLKYGGYSKALDMYTRTTNLTRYIEYLYGSEYMTPELFTTFLKYMYSMGRVFSTYWTTQEKTNNWGSASCSGFFQLIGHYPEFRESEAWTVIMMNRLEEITGNILFDDGACIELSHGYTQYTLGTLLGTKDAAETLGVEVEYTESIKQKVLTLAKFLMYSTGPGWRDIQEGDAHTFASTSYKSYLKRVGDWLGDPHLLWAAYDGKKGEKPDFTSLMYPISSKVYMRSDWGSNDLYLATSADASQGSHGHWDDNNVIVAAYGNYLLSDQLYYMLSGGQDLTCRWLFSSRAHNTMQINDYCQKAAKSVYDPTLPLGGSIGTIEEWETNDGYDFNRTSSENYKNITYRGAPNLLPAKGGEVPPTEPGMDYSRSILFVRPNFWILSDYMDPVDKEKVNKYTQLWHMTPGANMSIDGQYQLQEGETVGDVNTGAVDSVIENTQFVPGTGNGTIRSNFENKANIMVVPADISSVEPKMLRGLYSEGTGSQQRTPYALFEKNIQGTTTMDTILFPQESGRDYSVESTPQQTGQRQGAASAFSAVVKDQSGKSNDNYSFDYYLLHEEDQQKGVMVGKTTTDGKLMYYEKDFNTGRPSRVILRGGTYVKDLAGGMTVVESEQPLEEFTVTWENTVMKLNTSKDMADLLEGVSIHSPVEIKSVLLNGEVVPFYYADNSVCFDMENKPADVKPSQPGGGNNVNFSMGHGGGGGNKASSSATNPGGVNPNPGTNPGTDPVGPPVPPEVLLKQQVAGHWGETEISSLIDSGIVKGSNGTLDLSGNVSRAEFTAMIVRALGLEPAAYDGSIADVSTDAWYAGELQAAVQAGILQGDGGNLRPDDLVTREEMAKIILAAYRQTGGENAEGASIPFADEPQISGWAKEAVEQASKLGLVRGFETGEFRPQENAQREQAMVMIYRLLAGTKQKDEG